MALTAFLPCEAQAKLAEIVAGDSILLVEARQRARSLLEDYVRNINQANSGHAPSLYIINAKPSKKYKIPVDKREAGWYPWLKQPKGL